MQEDNKFNDNPVVEEQTDANSIPIQMQPPQQKNDAPYVYHPSPQKQQDGFAIASMVLGIFSLTFAWCFAPLVSALVGLVLGIVSLRKGKNGIAIAGVVTSSIAILISVIFIVLLLIGIVTDYAWNSTIPGYTW